MTSSQRCSSKFGVKISSKVLVLFLQRMVPTVAAGNVVGMKFANKKKKLIRGDGNWGTAPLVCKQMYVLKWEGKNME